MALRPRWIATQGLTIGLTPIVVAIQGLWAYEIEDDAGDEWVFGGGTLPARPSRIDADRKREKRLRDENMNRIAMICAAAVEEYL